MLNVFFYFYFGFAHAQKYMVFIPGPIVKNGNIPFGMRVELVLLPFYSTLAAHLHGHGIMLITKISQSFVAVYELQAEGGSTEFVGHCVCSQYIKCLYVFQNILVEI